MAQSVQAPTRLRVNLCQSFLDQKCSSVLGVCTELPRRLDRAQTEVKQNRKEVEKSLLGACTDLLRLGISYDRGHHELTRNTSIYHYY